MIVIALILTITIPISSSSYTEQHLTDLCSETKRSNQCLNIFESKLNKLNASDDKVVSGDVINLAIAKSKEIYDEFFQYYLDSNEDELKEKYLSCAKNLYSANCGLEMAQRDLEFHEFASISNEIDDVEEELNKCRGELGEETFELGRFGDGTKELGLYLEIVRAAAGRIPDDDGEVEVY